MFTQVYKQARIVQIWKTIKEKQHLEEVITGKMYRLERKTKCEPKQK